MSCFKRIVNQNFIQAIELGNIYYDSLEKIYKLLEYSSEIKRDIIKLDFFQSPSQTVDPKVYIKTNQYNFNNIITLSSC